MILHESKYVKVILEEENSLIIDLFLPASEGMTTEEFKEEMLLFAKLCEKHKPERELANLLDMKYLTVPNVQEWMDAEIFPKYQNIIKRMAFLLPEEIVASMSIEQTMETETGLKFVQKFFDNESKAKKWLMEA